MPIFVYKLTVALNGYATTLIQLGQNIYRTENIKFYIKIAVFWVVAPCSLVEVYQRFRGPCCLQHQGDRPDDGGSKDLWNVGKLLPDYTVLQPRIKQSSMYA
jgi:hypothetical protein